MASKKARAAGEATVMLKDQTPTVPTPAKVQPEKIQCPKCMGRDKVEMPVVDDKGEIISPAHLYPGAVTQPFCNRCMHWIEVLEKQVWEDRPEALPIKARKPRKDGAA